MPTWKEFRFVINGKINGEDMTPLNVPMAHLAEYLADLATLMGHRESVHLVAIADGSTAPVMYVDATEESRVIHRVRSAQRGMGPNDANVAYKKLDDRLRDDDAIGGIVDVEKSEEVIEFPGRTVNLPQPYGPLKEKASLVGQLKRVGGFDQTVPVHLQRADDEIFYCEAEEIIAKQLAPLYSQTIRVHGIATYSRGKEGLWNLDNFKIQSFDANLSDDSFSATIEKLRAIPGNEWNQVADPLEELQKIRHGEDKTTQ
ncbi:MAG TPA: hypothetical protein VMO80_09895 [Terriglobales bacterium]|nr:hypothetical protein [Terriglobales bacterium]